ncbi:MAG: RIP metalloprotease RseP [Muribaculaceae bacterium]|nr:RIP metalloprotease RseP [Muribaculaceae bacterium]
METFFIKAAQLILALAILIIIHEFGHFLFARIFGIKVEKFYIFFDPVTEIFKWKPCRYVGLFGKSRALKGADAENAAQAAAESDPVPGSETPSQRKARTKGRFWKDTEYGIGWIPLGGYCKIAGMIDESMDTEQMKQPVKSWEFRAKPAWQRLLVMIAGVLFNFLTAIIIYAGIVYATGEKYVPVDKAAMGMAYSPEAQKIGFRDGDIPLSADGVRLVSPAEARMQMIQAGEVKVLRGSDTVAIPIPKDFIFRLDNEAKSDSVDISFFTYRMPVVITRVMPGEGADKGGMRTGDRILAVDSVQTPSLDLFFPALEGHEGKTVALTVARAAAKGAPADTIVLRVPLNESSKMGVGLETDLSKVFPAVTKTYNIFQSVPRGIEMGTERLVSYARSMKLVFTKEGAKSVGGFGTIGSIFPESWDWIAFWNIAAFLAVALAFMNILPIPALDGGHVIFLIWEMITGKPASQKVMEWTTTAGMVLLIALLLYANGMDIVRFFGK